MKKYSINPISKELLPDLQRKIDSKTKPLGALGCLEEIALKIGLVQNTLTPSLTNPTIVVFAADHGIAREGVSAYPQEVTHQMVLNFLNGGAAINVFCRQHGITIKIVDAGVNYNFSPCSGLINAKCGYGTKSFLDEPAMTIQQAEMAIERGASIVKQVYDQGSNVIGFGEMGIGNTSSASILMSLLCQIPIDQCIGKGTGLDKEGMQKKTKVLSKVLSKYKDIDSPLKIAATFGGFEIVQISGAMLQAAELKMILLVDGFIATAAFLLAHAFEKNIIDYAIFCHQSDEIGHMLMLRYLGAKPILNLNMRLGEGTGCAVAYPIIQSAIAFINDMANFESANVSGKME